MRWFTKIAYFKIPFRRYLRTILAETYEIYVRMLNHIDKQVKSTLGWDGPDWRVQNACRACCYKVSLSLHLQVCCCLTRITVERRARDEVHSSVGS